MTTPDRLPLMADGDLKRLAGWLKMETRKAQALLAKVERERKRRRRQSA